ISTRVARLRPLAVVKGEKRCYTDVMSWTLKKKAQTLLAQEEGAIRKDWGGRIPIALTYPNTYAVGMSNLGFQTIYWHLNQMPDVVCEGVFLPHPAALAEHRA